MEYHGIIYGIVILDLECLRDFLGGKNTAQLA